MPETNVTPRLRAIYWVTSLTLAGVLLWYSLRGVEWLRVWLIIRRAHPTVVALVLAIMSFCLFIRALRWRVLLSADKSVPIPLAFWATSAGYLGNNVLPARAGEVIRALMVSRPLGISKAFVLTTAISERIVDAIVLSSVCAIVLLILPEKPAWLASAAKAFAALGLSGVAAITLAPASESLLFKFLASIPVPYRFRERLESILRQGLQGLRSFHDPGRLARFLLFTAIIWSLDGVTIVLAAQAIGISISLPVAFLLVAGLGLGSALPSTPGYVGIYQFVAVSVLTPFGLSRTGAIAYILFFQTMNYGVVLCWGVTGLTQQRESAWKARSALV